MKIFNNRLAVIILGVALTVAAALTMQSCSDSDKVTFTLKGASS